MITEMSMTLDKDAKLTSDYTRAYADGSITIYPTWNDLHTLRINASPDQLRELRDLIDKALNQQPEPTKETASEAMGREDDKFSTK